MVLIVGIIYIYFKIPSDKKYRLLKVILVTLSAGAVGNLIDRIKNGYVDDFIDFYLINFPVFNFADICVCLSMIGLVISIFFVYKDKDMEFLKIRKKKVKKLMNNNEFEDIIELNIDKTQEGERIDKFLSDMLSSDERTYSRSYIQKLIETGNVCVNDKNTKTGYKISYNDLIKVMIPYPEDINIVAENIPLDIVYEDDDIILVNKPKGMVVHPSAGHYTGTLVNALMYHCSNNLSGINGVMRPGIVHRIDKDTTGIIVACKNDAAHISLSEQLKEHSITRYYYAICHNCFKEKEGTIDAPIGRHPVDRKKWQSITKTEKSSYPL